MKLSKLFPILVSISLLGCQDNEDQKDPLITQCGKTSPYLMRSATQSKALDPTTSTDSLLTTELPQTYVGLRRYLVTMERGTSEAEAQSIFQEALHAYLETLDIAIVDLAPSSILLESLSGYSSIKAIESDTILELIEEVIEEHTGSEENDSRYPEAPRGVVQVKAPSAWDQNYFGDGIKVGILDTGISNDHPDLNVRAGVDFTGSDKSWGDVHGHGTHVAGTACAPLNNIGVAGVAPTCELYAVKVLNDEEARGTASNILMGIEWSIERKLDVINMSFGGRKLRWDALERAFLVAEENGIISVAAVGNEALEGNKIIYPATSVFVLGVGAVNERNQRAYFSNYGQEVEIVAPGVNVESTTNNGSYGSKNGTSMATPHVAGAAAILRYLHPLYTAKDIKNILKCSATKLSNEHKSDEYGYGLLNIEDALQASPECNIEDADYNVQAFDAHDVQSENGLKSIALSVKLTTLKDSAYNRAGSNAENVTFTMVASTPNSWLGSIELTTDDQGMASATLYDIDCGYFDFEVFDFQKYYSEKTAAGELSIRHTVPIDGANE